MITQIVPFFSLNILPDLAFLIDWKITELCCKSKVCQYTSFGGGQQYIGTLDVLVDHGAFLNS